jgi:hypothetical protein
MGEMADAIMDGDCCEMCGEFFSDIGEGYPRMCSRCRQEEAIRSKSQGKGKGKRRDVHGII